MKLHVRPLASALSVALLGAVSCTPAFAQSSTGNAKKSQPKELQAVVVTASRITRPDLSLPTTQVPVPRQLLNLNIRTNVGASLNDLPYVRGTVNPENSAPNSGGISSVDLRGLGVARTLVLVDGRRFLGDTNLNSIPSSLVKNVQIVTGGASAAWGSGAVSGVVNIVLKNHLNGVTLGATTGLSAYHDAGERKFMITAGSSFGGGKGQFTFGANYTTRGKVWSRKTTRGGEAKWGIISIGGGKEKIAPDVGRSDVAVGGLINTGVLKGMAFNPDGSLRVTHLGVPKAGILTSGFGAPYIADISTLIAPLHTHAALANVHYKFNDGVTVMAQLRQSGFWNYYPKFSELDPDITINIDNAFLPEHVKNVMMANDETSFTMGRLDNDVNVLYNNRARATTQETLGLSGAVDDWHWKTYVSHAKRTTKARFGPVELAKQWSQAVDSVIDPVTGEPICRVTLENPSVACVPINLFGQGSPSEQAIQYVTGIPSTHGVQKLDVFSATISGAPFSVPAGLVSVAAGVDWRRVSQDTRVTAQEMAHAFREFNTQPLAGSFNVKEAFGEVLVPLVSDHPGLHNFNADAAARLSKYSLSGKIWSWKIGLTNEFFGGIRGRVDLSRDIRAPNVSELFTASAETISPVIDPATSESQLVPTFVGGNPDLNPEKATTWTGGLSWTPPAIQNLSFSVDYFNIKIKHIISSVGAQGVLNRCAAGNSVFCARVTRKPDGTLLSVSAPFVNLDVYKTDGADVDISYRRDATLFGVGGQVRLRTLATWVHKLTTNDGVSTQRFVGTLGNGQTLGVPKWKGVLSLDFVSRKFSLTSRVRWISSGKYDRNARIVNNDIGNYFYFDAGASYRFGPRNMWDLHFNVVNLANKRPPHGTAFGFAAYYSAMGRYYTLGLRVKFR